MTQRTFRTRSRPSCRARHSLPPAPLGVGRPSLRRDSVDVRPPVQEFRGSAEHVPQVGLVRQVDERIESDAPFAVDQEHPRQRRLQPCAASGSRGSPGAARASPLAAATHQRASPTRPASGRHQPRPSESDRQRDSPSHRLPARCPRARPARGGARPSTWCASSHPSRACRAVLGNGRVRRGGRNRVSRSQ